MGVVAVMSSGASDMLDMLKAGELGNLQHVHKPTDREGKPSLWPDGVTDGQATGWFEEPCFIHFWGGQNFPPLLAELRRHGIIVEEFF